MALSKPTNRWGSRMDAFFCVGHGIQPFSAQRSVNRTLKRVSKPLKIVHAPQHQTVTLVTLPTANPRSYRVIGHDLTSPRLTGIGVVVTVVKTVVHLLVLHLEGRNIALDDCRILSM